MKTQMALFLLTLVCLAGSVACSKLESPGSTEVGYAMEAYTIPPQYGRDIAQAIKKLVTDDDGKPINGRVQVAPNGQLLVAAPAQFQAGVKKFVAALGEKNVQTAPTITFDYWVIIGHPGIKKTNLAKEFTTALEVATRDQDPQGYYLLERLSSVSLSGQHVVVEGTFSRIVIEPAVYNQNVVADLDFKVADSKVKSRLQMVPGKLTVLGQTGLELQQRFEKIHIDQSVKDSRFANVFFVLRPTVSK